MSSLTQCNYCNLRAIKRRIKGTGARVRTLPSKFAMGGFEVFVVPKGKELDTRNSDEGGTQWRAWMMEIPSECVC